MNVKLIIFITFASFPLTFSFLLSVSQLNVVNSYALVGIIASTLLFYVQRNAKAAIVTVCGPLVPALYLLVLYRDPNLVLSLGSGYLLTSPPMIFLSSLAENPRRILTSYLFSCGLALVILNVVLAGIATADSLLVQFGAFLVATFLGKILPFYPTGGFGLAGELLAMPLAIGAVGLAFLLTSSPKSFNVGLSGYARMAKAMSLSAVFISLIGGLSLISSSTISVIIAVSVLALSVAVFQISRRT